MYGRGYSFASALGMMDPNAMELGSALMRPTLVSGKKVKPRPVDWERILIDRILRDIRDPQTIPGRYE